MTEQEIRRAFSAQRLPGGTKEAIQSRLETALGQPLRELSVRVGTRRRVWPRVLRAAGGLVLTVGVGLFLLWPLIRPTGEQSNGPVPVIGTEQTATGVEQPVIGAEQPVIGVEQTAPAAEPEPEAAAPSGDFNPEELTACVRAQPGGGAGTYTYELYDLGGKYVCSLGPYTEPLTVNMLKPGGRLVVIGGSAGPSRGTQWRCYYDPADGTLSEAYFNVLYESEELILCGGLDRLSVCEPLTGQLLCELTDFSEPFAPTADSPFLSAETDDNGVITVFYLAGEDFHTVNEKYIRASAGNDGDSHPILVPWQPVDLASAANPGTGAGTSSNKEEDDGSAWANDLIRRDFANDPMHRFFGRDLPWLDDADDPEPPIDDEEEEPDKAGATETD